MAYKPKRKRRSMERNEDGQKITDNGKRKITLEEGAALCDIMLRGVGVTSIPGDQGPEYVINRPRKLDSPDQLVNLFIEYVEYIRTQTGAGVRIFPDIEGFCAYSGVTRRELRELRKKPTLNPIIDRIFNSLAAYAKQLGYSGEITPIVLAMDFNNNYDYVSQNNAIKIENTPVSSSLPSVSEVLAALPVQTEEEASKTGKTEVKQG